MHNVAGKLKGLTLLLIILGSLITTQPAPAQISELDDAIGGDGLIPANPDFNFGPFLKLRGQDLYQPLGALSSTQVAAVEIETGLAQALQQSISVSNRPSVLTPYSETIISRDGKEYDDAYGSYVTNKARTIGRGILGIGLNYQYSNFDEFDGDDIGKAASSEQFQTIMLQNVFVGGTPSPLVSGPLDVASRVTITDVEIEVNQIVLALNYGLLSNLDVGVLIPYLHINTTGEVTMEVEQNFRGGTVPGDSLFELDFQARSRDKFDRDNDGVGDIVLFTKLQILSQFDEAPRINAPIDLATQVEVKVPTGDEDKFLGNGEFDGALRVLVQKSFGETQWFTLRGDLGGTLSGLDSEFHSIEAKIGVEVRVHDRLGLSAEIINIYNDAYNLVTDFAAGGKVKITRNFKIFGGFRMPINDNGLRAPFSPIAGFEFTLDTRPLFEGGEDLQAFRETTIGEHESVAMADTHLMP